MVVSGSVEEMEEENHKETNDPASPEK